jgi:hypothetical protein
MTRQEINMILYEIKEILVEPNDRIRVSYRKIAENTPLPPAETPPKVRRSAIPKQQSLGF